MLGHKPPALSSFCLCSRGALDCSLHKPGYERRSWRKWKGEYVGTCDSSLPHVTHNNRTNPQDPWLSPCSKYCSWIWRNKPPAIIKLGRVILFHIQSTEAQVHYSNTNDNTLSKEPPHLSMFKHLHGRYREIQLLLLQLADTLSLSLSHLAMLSRD